MPAKGTKRAKAKGEGHASDISDNIECDDWPTWARLQEQRNGAWECGDWPTWERLERANLPWRIHCAIQEQRYEDISDLDDAMIAEHCHLQQQWELAEHEDRYDDCTRLRDAIHRHLDIYIAHHLQQQWELAEHEDWYDDCTPEDKTPAVHAPTPAVHALQPQALPSVIGEDTIRAAQLAHAHDNPPVQATQEKMDNAVPDKRCTGDSLVLRITHAPILAIPSDIVPAVRTMLEATAAQQDDVRRTMLEATAAQQDDVRKHDHDNMGQGETTGCDYDASDKMSNAADKLQAQIDDKDVRGGWKNFVQLPAWGDGAGEGGTWDPGPPHIICFLDLSHNFARYFFPDCTLVR